MRISKYLTYKKFNYNKICYNLTGKHTLVNKKGLQTKLSTKDVIPSLFEGETYLSTHTKEPFILGQFDNDKGIITITLNRYITLIRLGN